MPEAPRSNRPAPRTAAAMEAELRRRVRLELVEARAEAHGELDDAALAAIVARAIASALSWHLEAPEHTRNATLSSRSWRPAGGPRGGRGAEPQAGPPARGSFEERPPRRPYEPRPPRGPRDFERDTREFDRGPREFDRGPREYDRGPREYDRGPRDYDGGSREYDRGPREYDRGPRKPSPPPPRGRGGGFKRGGGGGGFTQRRPPRGR
jgi:hypothetical protein